MWEGRELQRRGFCCKKKQWNTKKQTEARNDRARVCVKKNAYAPNDLADAHPHISCEIVGSLRRCVNERCTISADTCDGSWIESAFRSRCPTHRVTEASITCDCSVRVSPAVQRQSCKSSKELKHIDPVLCAFQAPMPASLAETVVDRAVLPDVPVLSGPLRGNTGVESCMVRECGMSVW